MSRQVRLTDFVVAAIESEMQPRETYSEVLERLLRELADFRRTVRIVKTGETKQGIFQGTKHEPD